MVKNFVSSVVLFLLFCGALAQQKDLKSSSASDEFDESRLRKFHPEGGEEHLKKHLIMSKDDEKKAENCLKNIEMKVCDPYNMLSDPEKQNVDNLLRELEESTKQQTSKDERQREGIKLIPILLKKLRGTESIYRKFNDRLQKYVAQHPNERVAVVLFSSGFEFRPRQPGVTSQEKSQEKSIQDGMTKTIPNYLSAERWDNFYITSTPNLLVSREEIYDLYRSQTNQMKEVTVLTCLTNFINGLKEKALQKQQQQTESRPRVARQMRFDQQQTGFLGTADRTASSQFNQQFSQADTDKVNQCLQQFEAKFCDPDNILSESEKLIIENKLRELETQTTMTDADPRCGRTGVKLTTILLREVRDHSNVDQQINNLLNQWSRAHECDRVAVVMLSPGPDYRNAGGMVWSKFYGISNLRVPIASPELVGLYENEKPLIRQAQYYQALLNIINNFRDRIQKGGGGGGGRLKRQTNLEVKGFAPAFQPSEIRQQQQPKQWTEGGKGPEIVNYEDCLRGIPAGVCDQNKLLSDQERSGIENALRELQSVKMPATTSVGGEICKPRGYTVTILMVPYTQKTEEQEKKVNNIVSQFRSSHPCDPVAVIMLSPGTGNQCVPFAYPGWTCSKFYAISTKDFPVTPQELVKLYDDEKHLIREGKLAEGLNEIIKNIKVKIV